MAKLKKTDYLALGTICLLFLARCFFLGRHYMWFDEVLSFNLIHDPSSSHMLLALGDQADGGGPLYYLVARAWAAVFSEDPMLLRMFSSVGICAGFWLLWVTMRQAFAFFPTLLAVATVALPNSIIDDQALNIRFYGLLFGLVGLAVYLGSKLCRAERASWGLLTANALTQAALVLCNPLGGFYGAAIMCGVVLSDFLASPTRFRPAVAASYGAGWLAILLWLRQFLRQADINNPSSWVPVPRFKDLSWTLHQDGDFYPLLLMFPVLLLFSRLAGGERLALSAESKTAASDLSRVLRSQLLIAVGLVGITPFFWVISRVFPKNSIFVDRYMMATTVGWTVVCAFLVSYICDRIVYGRKLVLTVAGLLVVAITLKPIYGPLASTLRGRPPPNEDALLAGKFDSIDNTYGHLSLPIVCLRSTEFVVRRRHAVDPGRYFYLLNWQASVAPEAEPGSTVLFKIFSALKRYSYKSNVMEAAEFLGKNDAFLVLDVPGSHWCSLFLKPGQYKITQLESNRAAVYDRKAELPVWLVEKPPPDQKLICALMPNRQNS
jgi:hypothetical protein